MSESAPAIRLQQVRKRYGEHVALDGLDLEVGAGEVLALLGPNGAGKTTTIRLLLGFAHADAGHIELAGCVLPGEAAIARQRLAYIPEQVNLYPTLSGLENLDYFTRLAGHRLDRGTLLARLAEAGLDEGAAQRRSDTYSKGMRQKVGVAIALAKQAQVLLLDEPTSGLDPSAANEFNALLRRTADRGVAVLMATHDLFRAQQAADRVAVLDRGRLIAVRETAELALEELETLYLALIGAERAA